MGPVRRRLDPTDGECMTEILTESFCERCGTRYTFEPVESKRRPLSAIGMVGRGIRHFVTDPGSSLDEAFAVARSETEQRSTASALEAFHRTFNFCLTCRQYTCGDCWNAVEGRCLTCAPTPEALAPATRADTRALVPPMDLAPTAVALLHAPETIGLEGTGSPAATMDLDLEQAREAARAEAAAAEAAAEAQAAADARAATEAAEAAAAEAAQVAAAQAAEAQAAAEAAAAAEAEALALAQQQQAEQERIAAQTEADAVAAHEAAEQHARAQADERARAEAEAEARAARERADAEARAATEAAEAAAQAQAEAEARAAAEAAAAEAAAQAQAAAHARAAAEAQAEADARAAAIAQAEADRLAAEAADQAAAEAAAAPILAFEPGSSLDDAIAEYERQHAAPADLAPAAQADPWRRPLPTWSPRPARPEPAPASAAPLEPIPTAVGQPIPASSVAGPLSWPDAAVVPAPVEPTWPDVPVHAAAADRPRRRRSTRVPPDRARRVGCRSRQPLASAAAAARRSRSPTPLADPAPQARRSRLPDGAMRARSLPDPRRAEQDRLEREAEPCKRSEHRCQRPQERGGTDEPRGDVDEHARQCGQHQPDDNAGRNHRSPWRPRGRDEPIHRDDRAHRRQDRQQAERDGQQVADHLERAGLGARLDEIEEAAEQAARDDRDDHQHDGGERGQVAGQEPAPAVAAHDPGERILERDDEPARAPDQDDPADDRHRVPRPWPPR